MEVTVFRNVVQIPEYDVVAQKSTDICAIFVCRQKIIRPFLTLCIVLFNVDVSSRLQPLTCVFASFSFSQSSGLKRACVLVLVRSRLLYLIICQNADGKMLCESHACEC